MEVGAHSGVHFQLVGPDTSPSWITQPNEAGTLKSKKKELNR